MNISYESADIEDIKEIAQLHTRSWQVHYRNIYTDDYLDKELAADRLKVWTDRFSNLNDNQFVIKAMNNGVMVGFACTYLYKDPEYGALLDNLHVLPEAQGCGVGRNLMLLSAKWVTEHSPESGLYLYVLDQNKKAIEFYRKRGPEISEPFNYENPGIGIDSVLRCSWTPPIEIK